ncbi:MAG: amidohydrolase family protein [Pyrinomonadaceae bacterium]|nr:amidohydrolase family protein [Pyrinomonadaceae bacterium]
MYSNHYIYEVDAIYDSVEAKRLIRTYLLEEHVTVYLKRLCESTFYLPFIVLFSVAFGFPVAAQVEKPKDEKKGLPLKTERKVEFTTNEGTWLSLDISPDGKTIIFDLLGELYRLPVSGGTAKPFMTGLAFDSQPRFSPDGKMIAFVSDRSGSNNLWISNADGSIAKQLSKEDQAEFASPIWTPDGDYVIVSKASQSSVGAYDLWIYHRLGGAGLRISKGKPPASAPGAPPRPGPNSYGAIPTKDGKYIYYARQSTGNRSGLSIRNCQIVRRNRITGEEDMITFARGNAFRPLVSNNGNTLIFGTRYEGKTGLKIRDLNSGEERWLKYPIQRDEQESRATRDLLPGYVFTPDQKHIIISYGGKIHRVAVADGRSTQIPFSAKVSLDVGPSLYVPRKLDRGAVKARLIQEPEVSPNGKSIVFSALTAVYAMDLGTRRPRRLTKTSDPREFQPSWSPDGNWIAFVSWSTGGGHIWKMRSNGSGIPQKLTQTPAFYKEPVWTPDGKQIIALQTSRLTRVNHPSDFLAPQPGLDIVKLPANGGKSEIIVPSRGLGKPHFSTEKDRIYVYGNQGLISFRFDGTDRRTHFKVEGKRRRSRPSPARDVRISPDGKHGLALVSGQIYYFAVPRAGGNTPTINVGKSPVPIKKLSNIGADSFGWSRDSKTVYWTVGSSFYRQRASTISFEPPKKQDDKKEPNGSKKKIEEEERSPAEEINIAVQRQRFTPRGTAVLRGGRAITMRGKEIIEDSDIVIVNDRISAIGRRGSVSIPSNARVFDINGKTVIPGLIDIHAHWEVRHSVLDTEDYTFWGNLAYGVTTGRDPQTNSNDTFAYQDLVETGEMIGPRIFSTGPGLFSDQDFKTYKQAKDTVARYQKHYRTNTLKSYLVGNRKQRQWVVRASKELGIIPTTEGGSNLKLNLTHAIDGFAGNEHALPVVPIYDDVIQLYAKSGITYTPTLVVTYGGPQAKYYFFEKGDIYSDKKLQRFNPQAVLDEKMSRIPWFRDSEHIFPQIAKGAADILAAGGRVGIGGHGELQGLQCHWEMWGFAMGGMKNHDVLRTATIMGAEAIGFGQELGSLEKGKMADLIVLDKNPLDDIRNTNTIRFVMKNGEMFEGDTLNQVYPQSKRLPTPWWWKGKPY